MSTSFFRSLVALAAAMVVWAAAAGRAAEVAEPARAFDIPAGPADAALRQFADQSGLEVLYATDITVGVRTNAVKGRMTPGAAIAQLLAGTRLTAVRSGRDGVLRVARAADPNAPRATPRPGDRPQNQARAELHSGAAANPTPPPVSHASTSDSNPDMQRKNPLAALVGWITLFLTSPAVPAQTANASGSIEGRVFNPAGESYVSNARVTIGGAHETFTDPFGFYRFAVVPAGTTKVRVFYTGFVPQEKEVTVTAGQRATADFVLGGHADPNAPVRLDSFIVQASRDMTAAAVAINEQRFTQSIKTVVSTDTFGDISDGNVGEFVKYLPGISLGFTGGEASSISVGGMPPESTPITIDGNQVASAAAETRAVQLNQISINNMSRVEVVRSRNPDSPANAIGGSVNLVPKSAFERRNSTYTLKTFASFRDVALEGKPFKVTVPNYELGAIVPVNDRFGFALNATSSIAESGAFFTTPVWVPNTVATSGNLPATPPTLPYLARYEFSDSPKTTKRQSAAVSGDWRVGDHDVISAGFQYGFFTEQLYGLPRDRVIINPGRVVAWGPDFTQGAAGTGFAQLSYSTRDVTGTTYQPNLRWRHNGPVWKWELGGAFSRSSYHDRNVDKGFWGPLNAYMRGLTIRFDHHNYLRPGGITTTNAAGQPVDTFKVADYRLETVGTAPVDRVDIVRSFNAHARRDFDLRVPVAMKVGIDYGSQQRDLRSGATTYTFVGADGIAANADNNVAPWFAANYLDRRPAWGLPIQEGIDSRAVYASYEQNPEHFQLTAANEVAGYRNRVNGSKNMTEAIYAPYIRFDLTSLMDRRLALTTGVRFERTEFSGVGPSINPSAIYQRDAAGNIVRNPAGQPVAIAPLATLPGTQLAYTERGIRTERTYDDLYPSLNASFNVRSDLIARVSYAKSIARPNFNYILPSLNLPDETSSGRTLTLTNPALRPWEADSYGVAIEYYFSERSAGLLSARGYLRDVKDFWGATSTPITDEIIDTYGLDATIYNADRGYVVNTRRNVGDARVSGMEVDYRQNLTFLPRWAEGLSVFANLTMQHLEGAAIADFRGFVQKTINYGVAFNRARFTFRANVNERGRERRSAFTGAGVEPGVYDYMAPRTTVDVSSEYRFTRRFALYGTVRNLFNAPENLERYGPSTPGYAKLRQRADWRPLITLGLRATF